MMMAAVVYKDLQSLPCAADQVIGEAGGLVSPHWGAWGGLDGWGWEDPMRGAVDDRDVIGVVISEPKAALQILDGSQTR